MVYTPGMTPKLNCGLDLSFGDRAASIRLMISAHTCLRLSEPSLEAKARDGTPAQLA